MKLKRLSDLFSVCRVESLASAMLQAEFCFAGRTDEEISLVCKTADAPAAALAREDGWRGFRIEGMLDFSLIGILAKISAILAECGIGIFVVSTFNTDYIFVKDENFDRAMDALSGAGYEII